MVSEIQDIDKRHDFNWEALHRRMKINASASREWLNTCLKGVSDEA